MRPTAPPAMCSEFLEAAAAIGRRIVDDAIWDGRRCGWVGAVQDAERPWESSYRALEANLYDGTAGVGLFLAQLAAVTGSADARRTALGAMRDAVGRPGRREGFHVGSLGVVWAAACVAALLDDEALDANARELAVVASPIPDGCPDVVFGSAGSLIARLALAEALDAPALVDEAVATGEQLLATARVTRHGWSWASIGGRHLCGVSHGAGGIGWALAELHGVTGDERFRAGATGAFAYERSWLDRDSSTWPDLRIGGQRRGACLPSPMIGGWCHGEAGIAHTRLRAMELLGPEGLVDDAGIALGTTRRHLAEVLPRDIADLTLCHGVSGAAEALLAAAGDPAGLPEQLGYAAIDRHDPTSRNWPCGMPTGTTPALFQGLSGIGWWFLRLHDPAIPSPLTAPIQLTPMLVAA
jgi:class II lanthipeptide synthase